MVDLNFWKKDYRLDKMGLKELWGAYLIYPAIQAYLVLAALSIWYTATHMTDALPVVASVIAVIIVYPFVWYLLHRFVLHGHFLFRSKFTAHVWKRIHFDHHRDPHDLKVLFGALYTTLPTILIVTAPVGYIIGGTVCAAAAIATGLLVTCFYEFCHCIQHLRYTPKWKFLQKMKKLHLQHHFHDETHNFGITNFAPDIIFGTLDKEPTRDSRSDTVFNLGYTGKTVEKYPWVAQLTKDIDVQKAICEGIHRKRPEQQDNTPHTESSASASGQA